MTVQSTQSAPVYAPCVNKNPITGELEMGQYNLTEMMEKAKLSRDARVKQLASAKKSLTTEEVNALAEKLYKKYDPQSMTSEEYGTFIKDLVSSGALNSTEAEWMDGNRVMVDPTAPGGLMQVRPGERLAYSISSANGNALLYLHSMKRKFDSGTTETDKAMSNAVSKADAVLRAIAKRREQEGKEGSSITEEATKRAQHSDMLQSLKNSLYNGYYSSMTVTAVRTRVIQEVDSITFSSLGRSNA